VVSETAELLRLTALSNGQSEAPRVEKYFSQTFGRNLPITARVIRYP
jgi:hypothetical protein